MTTAHDYTLTHLPVAGGELAVGDWGGDGRPVVALHGVTSTHRDWAPFAEHVGDALRVIAPDLRGRGGSSDIRGPWGMATHVDDVVAILDELGLERAVLVGHSMGGFVAVLAAIRHPERVAGLVLVDGGLPAVDANEGSDALTRFVLEAARARLERVFASREEHLDWRRSTLPPSATLSPAEEAIADYDLVPTDGGYRIAGSYPAIEADAAHITSDDSAHALQSLTRPAILLRAAFGLPPRTEGLYSRAEVEQWTSAVDSLSARHLEGVDHGTIIRDPAALDEIAAAARELAPRVD